MCITPFWKNDPERGWMGFACGKCPDCLKRRASGWSFRLMKEGERCSSSLFVTLTYENENLKRTPKGFKNLSKVDLQLFFKRLRYYNKDITKIKYYAVGEYGTHTDRPHYHIILFNASIEQVEMAWRTPEGNPIGNIHYGEVTGASIGYTLKYMCKPARIPMHLNDDRQKEFSLMSKG